MNGVPIPVHDPFGTTCQMTVSLQSQLPRIRRPVFKCLCLAFQYQIGAILQSADRIAAKCNFCSGQIILCRMVNIRSRNRYCLRRFIMIYVRLHSIRISILCNIGSEFLPFEIKIMRNELILPLIFLYDLGLPHQIFCRQTPLKFGKFTGKPAVNTSGHIRKI